jgi:hypothetical protein
MRPTGRPGGALSRASAEDEVNRHARREGFHLGKIDAAHSLLDLACLPGVAAAAHGPERVSAASSALGSGA